MMTIPFYHTVTAGNSAVKKVCFNNGLAFTLIAGPCLLESRDHAFFMAENLKKLTDRLNISFVYKTSFDKANRTSIKGQRGLGIDESLKIFDDLRRAFEIPMITDVHLPEQCSVVAESVDILQIPAFLCRQTDLLRAAAATSKPVNIKKGQFLAPWDMENVIKKVESSGNNNIMVCERGASFGYNTLVSDMRALTIMKQTGYPVIFDATHSVQQPGGAGDKSGGQREFVPTLSKAAVAVGIAGLFLETHQDPDHAPSDGPNMIPLHQLENLLIVLKDFDAVAKSPKAQSV